MPHVAWPGRSRVLCLPLPELLHVLRDCLARLSVQESLLPALAVCKLWGLPDVSCGAANCAGCLCRYPESVRCPGPALVSRKQESRIPCTDGTVL